MQEHCFGSRGYYKRGLCGSTLVILKRSGWGFEVLGFLGNMTAGPILLSVWFSMVPLKWLQNAVKVPSEGQSEDSCFVDLRNEKEECGISKINRRRKICRKCNCIVTFAEGWYSYIFLVEDGKAPHDCEEQFKERCSNI